jgi:glycosyltransferase involved in cell wall biosynthesis
MKVSVIVPSYNQAKYLPATLESLVAQDHSNVEVRVYDGGSTDGSVDVLSSHKAGFWWISEKDGGQAAAINRGLKEAHGDIVSFLNSDDIYYPAALSRVVRYFEENPECLILYGKANHLNADGAILEQYPTEAWNYQRLQETCFICQPSVFWRREVLNRFGLLDESLHYALDYEYWLRVGRDVAFHYLGGPALAGSRLHADTKTLSQRVEVHREILDVVIRHDGSEAAVYNWLGHLAFHEASRLVGVQGQQWTAVFASSVLNNAFRHGIRLSVERLQEINRHLSSAGI